ncbi:unnamed protein product [Parnassius mnemosyne]|uniref:Zinc finger PHD-type domain-containing protein n=1 Tax=Parnassius mnemosyne TaxID=213953 RepID=A0AAV1LRT0_9NEOP
MYSCCEGSMDDESTILCTHCGGAFHHSCMDPANSYDFSTIDTNNWTCPTCTAKKPKAIKGDNTPIRLGASQAVVNNNVTQRLKKKKTVSEPSSKVQASDTVSQITVSSLELREIIRQEIRREITELQKGLEASFEHLLNAKFKKIEDEMEEVKKSVSFINNKYDEIKTQLVNQEKSLKSMDVISADMTQLKTTFNKLESENNTRDQWARRSNIEICGVPEKKNENLITIIENLAKKADISFNAPTDMDFVTRVASLSKDNKKPKRIFVRFMSRYYKDEFLCKVRQLKNLKASDIGFSGNNSYVFFNDHLTTSNKLLLQKAKAKAKDCNYKFVWVKNCTIMVRQSNSSPVLHINSTNDLFKIK